MLEKEENVKIINRYIVFVIICMLLVAIFIEGIENSNNPFIKMFGISKEIIEKKEIIPKMLEIVDIDVEKIDFSSLTGLNCTI